MVEAELKRVIKGLDEYLMNAMNRYTLAGLAVGVVHDGRLVYTRTLGYADIARREPITLDTTFRIASISKTFTAIGIMQLWEQGKFKLDDPVNDYLKSYKVLHKDPNAPPVTFRHLLTHTSGIGEAPSITKALLMLVGKDRGFVDDESRRPSLAEFYEGQLQPELYPQQKWAYANHAYATLGQLVEDISGQPFPQYMVEHVFEPLGMTHTDYLFSERVSGEMAQGHNFKKGRFQPIPLRFRVLLGAGSVFSSVNEMAKYLAALMNGGTNDRGRILQPETLKMMMTSQLNTDPRIFSMGLAYWLDDFGGHRIAGHGGSHPGFISDMKVAPDGKLGVVVFTNTSSMAPEFIGGEIMRRLLGVPNPDADFPPKHILKSPHEWEKLCGFYGPKPGFLTNARLWLSFGGEIEIFVNKQNQLACRSIFGPAVKGIPIYRVDAQDPLLYRGIIKGGDLDGYPIPLLFIKNQEGFVSSMLAMQDMLYKRPYKQSLKYRKNLIIKILAGVAGWITIRALCRKRRKGC